MSLLEILSRRSSRSTADLNHDHRPASAGLENPHLEFQRALAQARLRSRVRSEAQQD